MIDGNPYRGIRGTAYLIRNVCRYSLVQQLSKAFPEFTCIAIDYMDAGNCRQVNWHAMQYPTFLLVSFLQY